MTRLGRSRRPQRGGFVLGLIVGLLVGLALALGVALYVTRVPVPFVERVPHLTPDDDKAEAERNRNWDPNAPLAVKPPPRPAPPPPPVPASAPVAAASVAAPPAPRASAASAVARPVRDPAAILSGQLDPSAASTKPGADPFIYFVQTGAFRRTEEAEAQRAALVLEGLQAKVVEREQAGQPVFRVRLGPFDKRDEADAQLEKAREVSAQATLVRVERNRAAAAPQN